MAITNSQITQTARDFFDALRLAHASGGATEALVVLTTGSPQ